MEGKKLYFSLTHRGVFSFLLFHYTILETPARFDGNNKKTTRRWNGRESKNSFKARTSDIFITILHIFD